MEESHLTWRSMTDILPLSSRRLDFLPNCDSIRSLPFSFSASCSLIKISDPQQNDCFSFLVVFFFLCLLSFDSSSCEAMNETERERERAVNFPQMTIVRHPTSGFPITSKHPWNIMRFHRCSFSFPSVDIVESMKSSSELCRVIVISSFDLSVITSADWRWPFYEGSSVVHLEWMNVESELRRKVLRISFQIDAIVPRTTRITTHGFSTLRTREWLLWTHERLVKPDPISTREVGNQQKW